MKRLFLCIYIFHRIFLLSFASHDQRRITFLFRLIARLCLFSTTDKSHIFHLLFSRNHLSLDCYRVAIHLFSTFRELFYRKLFIMNLSASPLTWVDLRDEREKIISHFMKRKKKCRKWRQELMRARARETEKKAHHENQTKWFDCLKQFFKRQNKRRSEKNQKCFPQNIESTSFCLLTTFFRVNFKWSYRANKHKRAFLRTDNWKIQNKM